MMKAKKFFIHIIGIGFMSTLGISSITHAADLKIINQGEGVGSSGSVEGHSALPPKSPAISGRTVSDATMSDATMSDTTMSTYIITGVQPSVVNYRGGIEGYASTMPEGATKIDIHSSAAQAYQDYLKAQQADLVTQIEQVLGRGVTVVNSLQFAGNMIMLELTAAEARKIQTLQTIRKVDRDQVAKLKDSQSEPQTSTDLVQDTSAEEQSPQADSQLLSPMSTAQDSTWKGGFAWIHAPKVWQGVKPSSKTMGEGVVIGIIDLGINPKSPSFAATGGDGYTVKNPRGSYIGVCDPKSSVYDPDFPCNDKLIGAWGYQSLDNGTAIDKNGHGSHVASIAAGNIVKNVRFKTPLITLTQDIAGVAPHANIISYRICDKNTFCPISAVVTAFDRAIQDGVDVINLSADLSIASDPWRYPISQVALAAVESGIFVSVIVGNDGPQHSTIEALSSSPWVMGVANASSNYIYKNSLIDLQGGDTKPPQGIYGLWITDSYGPAKIIDAAKLGNPSCEKDKFTQKLEGAIIVCRYNQTEDENNNQSAFDQGAGTVITIAEKMYAPGVSSGPGTLIPISKEKRRLVISYSDGERLLKWLDSGDNHTATLSGTRPTVDNSLADILVYDSSRGPEGLVPSLLKPDITAPGINIVGAGTEDKGYWMDYGTSMAAPHIAGGAALIKAVHPTWTPAEIQSALMTTAYQGVKKSDGQTPATLFDMGAGRVDLSQAVNAALLLNETGDDFKKADPFAGGDPSTLNLASLGQDNCVARCSWQRTVTNGSQKTTSWRYQPVQGVQVTPETFTLAPGETQTLTVSADVSQITPGNWGFAQVALKSLTEGVPDVHFPLAARSANDNLSQAKYGTDIPITQDAGQATIKGLKTNQVSEGTVTVYGPTKAQLFNKHLSFSTEQISKGANKFFYYTLSVPSNAKRFVTEILQTNSKDLGLFVGAGDTPDFNNYLHFSEHRGRGHEYINTSIPSSVSKLWVAVRAYASGQSDLDIQLGTAFLSSASEGLQVSVPGNVPAGEPFDATVDYNLPGSQPGDRYYGAFSFDSDSDTQDIMSLNLIRQ
jgi:subtilisin family serine protease